MRCTILLVACLGAVLFGSAFAISFLNPLLIERAAREIVRIEVERRVGEKVEALSNTKIVALAQRALGRTDAEIETARREIAESVPQKVADSIARMLDANCECRKRLAEHLTQANETRVSSLDQIRRHLATLIESSYASVTHNLLREFRIFTASNAVVFALLAVVTLVRPRAALQLALPALVLLGAACLTGGFYLFAQDWLHTILYSDYVGLAYVGYLGAIALSLADAAFNRARILTAMVNFLLNVVGSTVSAVPC